MLSFFTSAPLAHPQAAIKEANDHLEALFERNNQLQQENDDLRVANETLREELTQQRETFEVEKQSLITELTELKRKTSITSGLVLSESPSEIQDQILQVDVDGTVENECPNETDIQVENKDEARKDEDVEEKGVNDEAETEKVEEVVNDIQPVAVEGLSSEVVVADEALAEKEPVDESASDPVSEPPSEPASEPVSEPAESVEEAASEVPAESVEEAASEVPAESVEEAASEVPAESVEEAASEVPAESVEEAASEVPAESVEEAASEVPAESVEEAASEVPAESVEEAAPEVPPESAEESAPEVPAEAVIEESTERVITVLPQLLLQSDIPVPGTVVEADESQQPDGVAIEELGVSVEVNPNQGDVICGLQKTISELEEKIITLENEKRHDHDELSYKVGVLNEILKYKSAFKGISLCLAKMEDLNETNEISDNNNNISIDGSSPNLDIETNV